MEFVLERQSQVPVPQVCDSGMPYPPSTFPPSPSALHLPLELLPLAEPPGVYDPTLQDMPLWPRGKLAGGGEGVRMHGKQRVPAVASPLQECQSVPFGQEVATDPGLLVTPAVEVALPGQADYEEWQEGVCNPTWPTTYPAAPSTMFAKQFPLQNSQPEMLTVSQGGTKLHSRSGQHSTGSVQYP